MADNDIIASRRRYIQAAGIAGASVLAGCSSGSSDAESQSTDSGDAEDVSGGEANQENSDSTLDIAWPGGLNNMHPMGWLTIPDFDAVRMMYEPLVSVDDQARAIPHLADWETSDDGAIYTWNVQEDVTWHDGEPLTAEDVAFTFRLIKEYEWPYLGSLSEVIGDPSEFEVKDDTTVVTPLTQPYSALPLTLADLGLIVPKHVWEDEENPPEVDNTENPIGSGPFVFEERQQDQFLRFSVNDDYWGETPDYDEAIINIVPSTDDQILSLKKGETDLTRLDAGPPIDDVKQADNVDVVEAGSTFIRYISFQTKEKPFDDPNVRKAVAYAIDRDQIIDLIHGGYATKASSVLASGLEFYQNSDVPTYDYDVEQAESLLNENGYEMQGDVRVTPDGEEMRYELPIQNTGSWPRMADLLKRQLGQIGIDLTVDAMESNSYTDRVTVNHDYKITVSDWRLWFDPDPFLAPSFEEDGTLNFAEYNNDEFDQLMQEQRRATDPEQRREYLYDAQEIIAEELPWYTMFYPDLLFAMNSENWTNANPIPRYGMQSAYGGETGTGPLLQLDPQ